MFKQAYLIQAHNQFEILKKLLCLLDSEENDIYIHIDKKVKDFDSNEYVSICKKSNVFFVDRVSVKWGGYSQIQAELNLLTSAVKKSYDFYHLISGVDLPIKSNKEIKIFFKNNLDKNFIQFENCNANEKKYFDRVKYYYPIEGGIRANCLAKIVNRVAVKGQKLFKLSRKQIMNIYKGAQWFSINSDFAMYVVNNSQRIRKQFFKSLCCDELLLQSLIMESPYRCTLPQDVEYNDPISIFRLIDWKRGNPYIYRKDDFELLVESNCFWARKFDYDVDMEIVDKIFKYINNKNIC